MDRKIVYDKILGSMVCCALGDSHGRGNRESEL